VGPIPNLSFTGGAAGPATGGSAGGALGWTQGDWNPTVAGSGVAMQSAGGLSPWLIAAGAAGIGVALWLATRR
jgi:hypothetical protein